MLDRFVGGTERGSALGKFIEQSGVKTSVSGLLLMSLASAFLFGMIMALAVRCRLAG